MKTSPLTDLLTHLIGERFLFVHNKGKVFVMGTSEDMAMLMLEAVPNGWAKVDNEWIRIP